jgi:3-keto-L-gulonate-6-phosphate decarboxylase
MSVGLQTQIQNVANNALVLKSGTPVTVSGSAIVSLQTACSKVWLIVNLKTITATSIQFTLAEVDPQDLTTVLTGQAEPTTAVLTAPTTDTNAVASDTASTVFKVSWTVVGSGSCAVNCTLIGKQS